MTALAGMQEHVFSPYGSIQCTPVEYYGLDKQKFVNWNPYVNRPMTLPEALAESCDTYFYDIGYDFYLRGALDLDTIIAERLPLDRINHAFAELRKGDATRTVITFG